MIQTVGKRRSLPSPPLVAELRASARRELPYWVELDAAGCAGGIGGIAWYRFWALDCHGRLLAGPVTVPAPRHAFALPPGEHRLFVAVADRAGAIALVSTGVRVRGDIRILHGGALASTWEALVTVTLPGSATSASLESLKSANSGVTSASAMWIQAFGARGGDGYPQQGKAGGSGGSGGFAQCVTTLADYEKAYGTSTIYYYLGDAGSNKSFSGDGGASTVLLATSWALGTEKDGSYDMDGVLALAGGGGGGGAAANSAGESGGVGGVANSAGGGPMPASGSAGGGRGGKGGYGNGGAAYNAASHNGNDGVGGYGGKGHNSTTPKFTNGTPPGYDAKSGCGGEGDNVCGAGGGGGFGGGAGGGTTMLTGILYDYGGGGGGGGSWAGVTTRPDPSAEAVSTSSGSTTGVARIVFNLSSTS